MNNSRMHVKKLDFKLYCSIIKSNKIIIYSKFKSQNNSKEMEHYQSNNDEFLSDENEEYVVCKKTFIS